MKLSSSTFVYLIATIALILTLILCHVQEALSVLTSIKKRGLSPDHFTFTTLLMACGRTGNSDKVKQKETGDREEEREEEGER